MDKFKIVLSDLHLGAGYAGQGNLLEDFIQGAAFAKLLTQVAEESTQRNQEVELILAGDIFEFLQVPALREDESFDPDRAYDKAYYAPSDEVSSCRKMETIIAGHPRFFAALADFISLSPRRYITVIKGNHDINLHWLGVQAVIRSAIDAKGERESGLQFVERSVSREGIYVEHGNQYLEWINRWPDFEQPHDPTNPGDLYLPAGSRFVYLFLNEVERQHYWLDGVKPITALIWYLFALDFIFAVRAIGTLIRLLPNLIWGSLPIGWALTEFLRAHQRVSEHLENQQQLAILDRSLKERSTFYNEVSTAMGLYGAPREGEAMTHFRAYGYSALPRGQEEQQAQRDALIRVAAAKQAQEGARIVVFGHIHDAFQTPLNDGGMYMNAGTWTWNKDMTNADHGQWLDLFKNPQEYTQSYRLSYVRIDYDGEDLPSGRLLEYVPEPQAQPILWRRLLRRILGNNIPTTKGHG